MRPRPDDEGRPDFDAVIFDLDGLLLDTEKAAAEAGVAALAALGHRVDPGFMAGLAGVESRIGIERIAAHLGTDLDAVTINEAWGREMSRIVASGIATRPGAEALIDRLESLALRFAVATNSSTAGARGKIERSALTGRIEVVVGADEVPRGKPAPDVYLEAAARIGVDPGRCLAFDDSDTGTRAALDAGMVVVQVPDLLRSQARAAHHTASSLIEGARWAGLI